MSTLFVKKGTFNHCGRSKASFFEHHGRYVFQTVFAREMSKNDTDMFIYTYRCMYMCVYVCVHAQLQFQNFQDDLVLQLQFFLELILHTYSVGV